MSELFKKFYFQLMGLMLFVLGVIGVFALISYNPYDQSWDFSTETIVKNWGGVIGANISSAYLAFVGLSGYFVSICFLIWGVKIVRYTFITPDADTPWYKNGYARFTFFILSLVSLSGLLSCLDNAVKVPDEWVTSSYGGHVGMLVKSLLQDVIGYQFFLVIFLFLFIATALMAIGLSVDTWLKIIAITAICIGTFGSYIRRNIKRFSMLLFSFAKRLWVKKTTEITERQEETEKQVTRARKIEKRLKRKFLSRKLLIWK